MSGEDVVAWMLLTPLALLFWSGFIANRKRINGFLAAEGFRPRGYDVADEVAEVDAAMESALAERSRG